MSQNGQTHSKNLAAFAAKVCLTILGHYALKIKLRYALKHGKLNDS